MINIDPITGLPIDLNIATYHQIPLNSRPINLENLNAQGKQSDWTYPDNIPPVVARLQARDLTNPLTAQDLSTDGEFNLNVNIAKDSSGSSASGNPTPARYHRYTAPVTGALCTNNNSVFFDDVVDSSVIYGITYYAILDPNSTFVTRNTNYFVSLYDVADQSHGLLLGFGGWSIVGAGITSDMKGDAVTLLFPVPIDRAKTWPTATSILLAFSAFGGDIFCGGSSIVG